jgi:arginyl-tRNA synthetase
MDVLPAMLGDFVAQHIRTALTSGHPLFENLPIDDALNAVKIERPRDKQHGHYAVNVSPLARWCKTKPPAIAKAVADYLNKAPDSDGLSASTVAGFVNITLPDDLLANSLTTLLKTEKPGHNETLSDQHILLEYVSANPTGPLHIGHGRWAALGDSLVRIWQACGATITPEFYVNDAGVQMGKIAMSVFLRSKPLLTDNGLLDDSPAEIDYPYPGEYVSDVAHHWFNQASDADKQQLAQLWKGIPANATLNEDNHWGISEESLAWLNNHMQPVVKQHLLDEQKSLLARIGVNFENWFSEKAMLHDRGLVEDMLNTLKNEGHAFDEGGALWLKTTPYGDDKDRVLVKSDGQKTYLAADIAYHHQKFSRVDATTNQPQYNRVINIWGADHHGYIARMQAALISLGHLRDTSDPKFEIILGQLVNLIIDGERERMGKRRKMLTLADVVDEVGTDAVRYWMVSKSADTALDFDVDLAKSASNENPVFYVQYAHARCAGILRNAVTPPQTSEAAPVAAISAEALETLSTGKLSPSLQMALLTPSEGAEAKQAISELLLLLDQFEETVAYAGKARAPHTLARYTQEVASQFHTVYNACRVIGDDPEQTHARLALIAAVKQTIANGLALLGVSAPERM